jgi:hypothetical protein
LGEEGFGEAISRAAGEKEQRKRKKSIESDFKEIARRLDTTAKLLRSSDRRWEISAKRARAVTPLIRDQGYRVSEVAKFLRRDQYDAATGFSKGKASNCIDCYVTSSPSKYFNTGCLLVVVFRFKTITN